MDVSLNSPIGLSRILDVIRIVPLPEGALVADIGCGNGAFLAGLAGRGLRLVGIDHEPECITAASAACPQGRFVCGDVTTCLIPNEIDLAVCLGATHAFGRGSEALPNALRALSPHLISGGWMLVGEGFRRCEPAPEYAALLGEFSGIERTHLENVMAMESFGFTCLHAITATDAEWDTFEWAFFRRQGKVAWRDAWLRWGRHTMGFGVYLLKTTGSL